MDTDRDTSREEEDRISFESLTRLAASSLPAPRGGDDRVIVEIPAMPAAPSVAAPALGSDGSSAPRAAGGTGGLWLGIGLGSGVGALMAAAVVSFAFQDRPIEAETLASAAPRGAESSGDDADGKTEGEPVLDEETVVGAGVAPAVSAPSEVERVEAASAAVTSAIVRDESARGVGDEAGFERDDAASAVERDERVRAVADGERAELPRAEVAVEAALSGDAVGEVAVEAAPSGEAVDVGSASAETTASAPARPALASAAREPAPTTLAGLMQRAAGDEAEAAATADEAPADSRETPTRDEISAAFETMRTDVVACAAGEHGLAEIQLTVGSSGRVRSALVTGHFSGTPAGSCMARVARAARFEAFSAPTFSARYPFRL